MSEPVPNLSDPFADPVTLCSRSSKRRRRAPFDLPLQSAMAFEQTSPVIAGKKRRRTMRPAISSMSVREERKAMQEIRAMEDPQPNDRLKCNDMLVSEFALR
jgi:hypothetical protein